MRIESARPQVAYAISCDVRDWPRGGTHHNRTPSVSLG